MTKKTLTVLTIVLACGSFAWALPRYHFVNLGNFPGALLTVPQALNARHVVGYYIPKGGTGVAHGFLQTGKNFKNLEPPSAISSFLLGINDHGVIVGGYCDTNSACGAGSSQHGFIYDKGTFTTLDYSDPHFTLTADGINNLGQIVGGFCPGGAGGECPQAGGILPSSNAFFWDHGVFTTINFPGAQLTEAYAINDLGEVVGYYSINNAPIQGFLYQNDAFTTISVPGSLTSRALGINNSRIISGTYTDQRGDTHGFLYYKGVYTRLDVPNSTGNFLVGIDNLNAVITSANVASGHVAYEGVPPPRTGGAASLFTGTGGMGPIAVKWTVPVVINGHVYVAGQ